MMWGRDMKIVTQGKLENILLDSFQQMSSDKVPINWHISCDKASQIAETKNMLGCTNLKSELKVYLLGAESFNRGSKRFVNKKWPRWLTPKWISYPSLVRLHWQTGTDSPALLINTLILGKSLRTSLENLLTDSSDSRSSSMGIYTERSTAIIHL